MKLKIREILTQSKSDIEKLLLSQDALVKDH
jgi:hypothetical protein